MNLNITVSGTSVSVTGTLPDGSTFAGSGSLVTSVAITPTVTAPTTAASSDSEASA